MKWAPGSSGHERAAAVLALLLCAALWLGAGCAWLPEDLWDATDEEELLPELPPPLDDCAVLTILIDTSREGAPDVAERAREFMGQEFRRFGADITDSPEGAYWSLMILASQNSRRDGFILSVLLTARGGYEGYGPGMNVFKDDKDVSAGGGSPEAAEENEENQGRDAPESAEGAEAGEAEESEGASETEEADERAVATLYNGIAFGPHAKLDRQSRVLAQQAYTAIYPAAQRMCDYEDDEEQREQELESQLPAPPAPL
ncbi:MAG: hypothetical protein ACR2P8_03935 [Myxococcota bacterium]